jgi:hypothetical protein
MVGNPTNMPLPATDTIVTYPDGTTTSTGTVLHIEPTKRALVKRRG